MNPLFALVLAAATSTPVVRAVVYPDRAQVVRRGQLACGARALLRFENLPPAADASSFRATTDVGSVEGLRVESRPQVDAYAKDVADLEKQQRTLAAQQQTLNDERHRAEANAQDAQAYGDVTASMVSREMVEATPGVPNWTKALDVSLQTQLASSQEEVKVDAQLRDLALKQQAVAAKLAQLQAASARSAYRVEVMVSCPSGRSAGVELSYMVGGAGWQPAYEARADDASGAVELSTYATVFQATGEDWKGARLALSTAVPRQSATPPELQPLKIYANEIEDTKKVLVRRDEDQKHAEVSSEGGEAQAQGGLTAANQGLSVQLVAPDPADVPGDGTRARIFVARNRLPAHFAYRTAPSLSPFVFRVADATNTAPFPLLAGPVDAFRQNGFMGRYTLERIPMGAPLHLTFGADENIKVKRIVLQEIKRETGLFGGNQRFSFAYRFEVTSYAPTARKVELAEHVPVSELDDVHVDFDEKTTRGYALQKDDGIVTWKLELAPGEKKTVDLAFHVDVPSSYDTSGL